MHALIDAHRSEIAALCRLFAVRRLELFGSTIRGPDFDPERSDADFLVEFAPSADRGLAAQLDLKEALENVLGRPVDLVERPVIERSRNCIRRRHIWPKPSPSMWRDAALALDALLVTEDALGFVRALDRVGILCEQTAP